MKVSRKLPQGFAKKHIVKLWKGLINRHDSFNNSNRKDQAKSYNPHETSLLWASRALRVVVWSSQFYRSHCKWRPQTASIREADRESGHLVLGCQLERTLKFFESAQRGYCSFIMFGIPQPKQNRRNSPSQSCHWYPRSLQFQLTRDWTASTSASQSSWGSCWNLSLR